MRERIQAQTRAHEYGPDRKGNAVMRKNVPSGYGVYLYNGTATRHGGRRRSAPAPVGGITSRGRGHTMVLWQRVLMLVGILGRYPRDYPTFCGTPYRVLRGVPWCAGARSLLGSAWFVQAIISRWYPALKQRLGLTRVFKVLVGAQCARLATWLLCRALCSQQRYGRRCREFPYGTLGLYAWGYCLHLVPSHHTLAFLDVPQGVRDDLGSCGCGVRSVRSSGTCPKLDNLNGHCRSGATSGILFATFCVMALVGIGVNHPIMEQHCRR